MTGSYREMTPSQLPLPVFLECRNRHPFNPPRPLARSTFERLSVSCGHAFSRKAAIDRTNPFLVASIALSNAGASPLPSQPHLGDNVSTGLLHSRNTRTTK